jgi:hypothetical protein
MAENKISTTLPLLVFATVKAAPASYSIQHYTQIYSQKTHVSLYLAISQPTRKIKVCDSLGVDTPPTIRSNGADILI